MVRRRSFEVRDPVPKWDTSWMHETVSCLKLNNNYEINKILFSDHNCFQKISFQSARLNL